jgi:hypothetical protein
MFAYYTGKPVPLSVYITQDRNFVSMFRENTLPPSSGRLTEVLSAAIGHSSLPK